MSYILEALRKSEHERRLGQAPALPVLVEDMPPQRQRWLPWMVSILLLAMNGAAVLYFGFGGRETSFPNTQTAAAASPHHSAASAEAAIKAPALDLPADASETPGHNSGERETVLAKSADIPSAVVDNVPMPASGPKHTAPTASRSEPEKSGAVSHPVPERKPLPTAMQAPSGEKNAAANVKAEKPDELLAPADLKRISEKLTATAAPALHRKADENSRTDSKRETLPLLSTMPEDIRLRMPLLTVNMLAYSSVPEERFAVVNMVKYTNGDRLPGGAVLLEIRSDGLVLDLDGTRFRLPQR